MLLYCCAASVASEQQHKQDLRRIYRREIEVTSWLVSADDFSSRVARGANERVSAANE